MRKLRLAFLLTLLVAAAVAAFMTWEAGLLGGPQRAAPRPSGAAAQNSFTFQAVSLNGYTDRKQYAGSGAALSLLVGWRDSFHEPYEAPAIVLQQRVDGGTWRPVRAVLLDRATTLTASLSYKVATGRKSAVVDYRLAVLPGTTAAGYTWSATTSRSVTVVYENQARYTGLARTMYDYIQPYCPNAAVHVVGELKGSETIGYYHGGGYLIDIIDKAARYTAPYRRSVALHECAHERQFLNWGATPEGWDSMQLAATAIFADDTTPAGQRPTPHGEYTGPFLPYEHAADCAALSVNPGGYLGYGGYCNPAEVAAGRALMRGNQF